MEQRAARASRRRACASSTCSSQARTATCFCRPPVCAQSSSVARRKSSGVSGRRRRRTGRARPVVPGLGAAARDDRDVSAVGIPCCSKSQCRNGIQYRTSKPTSPSHGPTTARPSAPPDRLDRLADQPLRLAGHATGGRTPGGRSASSRPRGAAARIFRARRSAAEQRTRPPVIVTATGYRAARRASVPGAVRGRWRGPSRPSSSIPSATSGAAGWSSPCGRQKRWTKLAHLARVLVALLRARGRAGATCSSRSRATWSRPPFSQRRYWKWSVPSCVPAKSGSRTVSTPCRRSPPRSAPLVLIPTMQALCASESK